MAWSLATRRGPAGLPIRYGVFRCIFKSFRQPALGVPSWAAGPGGFLLLSVPRAALRRLRRGAAAIRALRNDFSLKRLTKTNEAQRIWAPLEPLFGGLRKRNLQREKCKPVHNKAAYVCIWTCTKKRLRKNFRNETVPAIYETCPPGLKWPLDLASDMAPFLVSPPAARPPLQ